MESVSTPRVSGSYMQSYVGRNVMVVGKVLQLRGDTAIIDSEGQITANLNREAHLAPGNGVQIIGKVLLDLSIKVMNSIDLGPNVDYAVSQTLVDLTHQYKDLFMFPEDTRMT